MKFTLPLRWVFYFREAESVSDSPLRLQELLWIRQNQIFFFLLVKF